MSNEVQDQHAEIAESATDANVAWRDIMERAGGLPALPGADHGRTAESDRPNNKPQVAPPPVPLAVQHTLTQAGIIVAHAEAVSRGINGGAHPEVAAAHVDAMKTAVAKLDDHVNELIAADARDNAPGTAVVAVGQPYRAVTPKPTNTLLFWALGLLTAFAAVGVVAHYLTGLIK